MTNAEKYLKEGELRNIIREFGDWYYGIEREEKNKRVDTLLAKFLQTECKPTLTEDERVILRNINNEIYTKIGRDVDTELYIAGNTIFRGDRIPQKDILEIILKPKLFQFIKERRRI